MAVPAAVGYPPPQRVHGHWQAQSAPSATLLNIWVPGHHDAYGHWTPGHYETRVIQVGAWTKAWVPGHW